MPGDFGKAFGGGADFVMAGGMFSGYDESGGDLIENPKTGKKYKQFYGMSSEVAMKKHSGGVANYRASEGKCVLVPYKGNVLDNCLMTLLGGLRSTCTYVGAKTLKELSKRTTFIRVQQHHNIVFGDEKDKDNKNDWVNKSKNKSSNKSNIDQSSDSKENVDDPSKYPIFDPANQSFTNLHVEKQALLSFLNETTKDNDNNNNNVNGSNTTKTESSPKSSSKTNENGNVDFFSIMSKEMKKEYFEFVYQKEQEKLKQQQDAIKK